MSIRRNLFLIPLILLLLFPAATFAAIAQDNGCQIADSSVSSISCVYTVAATNPLITIGYEGTNAAADKVTGCTANGTAMTKLDAYKGTAGRFIGFYYIVGKSGSVTVQCNASGADILG